MMTIASRASDAYYCTGLMSPAVSFGGCLRETLYWNSPGLIMPIDNVELRHLFPVGIMLDTGVMGLLQWG